MANVSSDLASTTFAIVDVETSGLSIRRDHLLQVGVVVVTGDGRPVDRYASLVRPRSRWWFRVGPRHIHGISRRQLRRAPAAADVLVEVARRLDGAQFVAHNAPFDIAFLAKAARRANVALPVDTAVCTLQLSRRLDPDRQLSHRLGELCRRYGVELVRPHDAMADADATAAILPHLLAAAGITSTDQLAGVRQPVGRA